MESQRDELEVTLPRGWTKHVKSALIHAVSLATTALTLARGQASESRVARPRLTVALDRVSTEVALLKEELAIKDGRWRRLASCRRPHYRPLQRMRILQLKAARGWSCKQTARAFLITEQTLRSWMRRVDERDSLLEVIEPVNRFPDVVRALVRQLSVLLPCMGKVRIAQILARAGLHLGATTIGRIRNECAPLTEDGSEAITAGIIETRVVTATCPGHVWHVDLTTVPTWGGFWVPWTPQAWPQSWPFCWWVAVIVDHFSRAAVGFAVFFKRPTSAEIQQLLDRAIRLTGASPKYLISDKGSQFWCAPYMSWCKRRRIRPRFGAVGKHGSIAVIERFIRSMKNECTRRILVPLALGAMRRELTFYVAWFNAYRPSQALDGRTPKEVHDRLPPANAEPRFEPRPHWPRRCGCASPPAELGATCGAPFTLVVGFLEDRKHLPIVQLRRAA